jgi:hypothetical protein
MAAQYKVIEAGYLGKRLCAQKRNDRQLGDILNVYTGCHMPTGREADCFKKLAGRCKFLSL